MGTGTPPGHVSSRPRNAGDPFNAPTPVDPSESLSASGSRIESHRRQCTQTILLTTAMIGKRPSLPHLKSEGRDCPYHCVPEGTLRRPEPNFVLRSIPVHHAPSGCAGHLSHDRRRTSAHVSIPAGRSCGLRCASALGCWMWEQHTPAGATFTWCPTRPAHVGRRHASV